MAVGLGDPGVDDQAMAVVHQRVADEAQLAGRVALAVEPAVGIGLGGVGGAAAGFRRRGGTFQAKLSRTAKQW